MGQNPHLRTLTDIAEMSCEKIVKEHEVKQTAGILLIGDRLASHSAAQANGRASRMSAPHRAPSFVP